MFNSVSEEQFMRGTDTGDVLLFRSNNSRVLGSWLTRAFTNSHFDHVAIILRFGNYINDLYVLEAVGEYGVRLIPWSALRYELYPGGFFDKICVRNLSF